MNPIGSESPHTRISEEENKRRVASTGVINIRYVLTQSCIMCPWDSVHFTLFHPLSFHNVHNFLHTMKSKLFGCFGRFWCWFFLFIFGSKSQKKAIFSFVRIMNQHNKLLLMRSFTDKLLIEHNHIIDMIHE